MKIQGPDKILFAKKEKEEIRILIDINGVLADFDKASCEVCDIDINSEEVRKHLRSGGRIDKFINDDKMWDKIRAKGVSFWEDLELLPWAKELYNALKTKSEMVAFLSSPSDNSDCAAGKVKWIKKHFDTKSFIITPQKHFCATPNSILIDDTQKKIDEFSKYGGKTFLWPNPLFF